MSLDGDKGSFRSLLFSRCGKFLHFISCAEILDCNLDVLQLNDLSTVKNFHKITTNELWEQNC